MGAQFVSVFVAALLWCEASNSGKDTSSIAADVEIQSRIEQSVGVAVTAQSTNLDRFIEVEKQLRSLREKNPEKLVQ